MLYDNRTRFGSFPLAGVWLILTVALPLFCSCVTEPKIDVDTGIIQGIQEQVAAIATKVDTTGSFNLTGSPVALLVAVIGLIVTHLTAWATPSPKALYRRFFRKGGG